jgi:hypothetical protein
MCLSVEICKKLPRRCRFEIQNKQIVSSAREKGESIFRGSFNLGHPVSMDQTPISNAKSKKLEQRRDSVSVREILKD